MNVTLNKRRMFARLFQEAGDGAAAGGGGAATAANADGTPAAGADGQQTQATAPAWHESIQDEGLKAFIAGKGFKDAGEAAKALQEAEGKTVVPESPDAYKLPVPEGQDGAFAQQAAAWMHEAGVPVAQAQALAEKWNAYQADLQQQADVARQQRDEADVATLRKEWGGQYDANVELGRRAVRSFVGQGEDAAAHLEKIETALGAAETFRLFHRIGKHLGEGTLAPASAAAPGGGADSLADLLYPSMKK